MWLVWCLDNSNWLAVKGPMVDSVAQGCSQVRNCIALTDDVMTRTLSEVVFSMMQT